MFKIIRRYLKVIDDIFYSTLDHLSSWRNLLIVITVVFCFMALKDGNPAVVATVFGCWTLILGFYFHYREKEGGSFHTLSEPTIEKVDPIEEDIKNGKDFGAE